MSKIILPRIEGDDVEFWRRCLSLGRKETKAQQQCRQCPLDDFLAVSFHNLAVIVG
jgi:hypothetical protein